MVDRAYGLFKIVCAIGFLMLLLISANAFEGGNCVCYYVGDCIFGGSGAGYRYSQCTGSCYAYSGWRYEPRCYGRPGAVYGNLTLV
ncbi:hypothetical protein D6825_02545 [Candidatus Woesearchaeota archaeon]|nr:MAG: hypothetical protein D6825_02545 [Candidatus Woesearchaeota archaeon]